MLNFPVDSNARLNRERIKGGETYIRNGVFLNEYECSVVDESDGHTISDLNRWGWKQIMMFINQNQ